MRVVRRRRRRSEGCVSLDSESLAGLATSDPEFYQYLRDNDHELLEFHDSEEEDEGERYLINNFERAVGGVNMNVESREYH